MLKTQRQKKIAKVVLYCYSYCSVKKCHQGKAMSIKNPTMNLNGNTTTPDIQVHGGMKVMYVILVITNTTRRHMRNHAHDWGGHATTGPNAHIRLGWMDARSWYQLTTLVNISNYMDSTHISS